MNKPAPVRLEALSYSRSDACEWKGQMGFYMPTSAFQRPIGRQPSYALAGIPGRLPLSPYPRDYPLTGFRPPPQDPRLTAPYPPKGPAPLRLEQVQQKLNGRILNVSRTSVHPEALWGKRNGQPVAPVSHDEKSHTGFPPLDNFLWKAEQACGYIPHFLKNMVVIPAYDGLIGGVASTLATAGVVFPLKVLGVYPKNSAANLLIFSLMIGTLGGLACACGGVAQAAWKNIRDLLPLFQNPAPEV